MGRWRVKTVRSKEPCEPIKVCNGNAELESMRHGSSEEDDFLHHSNEKQPSMAPAFYIKLKS